MAWQWYCLLWHLERNMGAIRPNVQKKLVTFGKEVSSTLAG